MREVTFITTVSVTRAPDEDPDREHTMYLQGETYKLKDSEAQHWIEDGTAVAVTKSKKREQANLAGAPERAVAARGRPRSVASARG